ncbi:MAG: methyltransferase family protein [Acidobacteriota bacterium]
MKATQFEFRFRLLIGVALYVVGFWAPWNLLAGPSAAPATTAWLAIPTLVDRWGWIRLDQASLAVTWVAIAFAFLGAALRVWGTAYLSASVVHSGAMHGERLMASGPYRFVRNPLYLGSYLVGLSIAILMPPSGAAVFVVLLAVFYVRLMLGEEAFLTSRSGEAYLEYKRQVPRLVPWRWPKIAAAPAHPEWLVSIAAELFPIGYAGCLAVLAWRYEPHVLIQCVLVSFGLSLVMRAFLPKTAATAE